MLRQQYTTCGSSVTPGEEDDEWQDEIQQSMLIERSFSHLTDSRSFTAEKNLIMQKVLRALRETGEKRSLPHSHIFLSSSPWLYQHEEYIVVAIALGYINKHSAKLKGKNKYSLINLFCFLTSINLHPITLKDVFYSSSFDNKLMA